MAHPLLEPPTLLEEIRTMGNMSTRQNEADFQHREMENRRIDEQTRGRQNNGMYTMERFIIDVLEIPREEYTDLNATERTEFIIDFAVEAINSGTKKEIHFTPVQNTDYKKIKLIYDKLVDDLKNMLCVRMGLSPCPRNANDVIKEAKKMNVYPRSIISDTPVGYRLLYIDNEFSKKTMATTKPKGGRKTKRRSNKKSRRRNNKSKGRK